MKKIFIFLILLFSGYCLFGQDKSDNSLNGMWQLYYGPFDINSPSGPDELMKMNWRSIPAAVPGNVEIDLLKLRSHPSLVLWSGNNENDASLEWTFSKHFDPGLERISRDILPRVIWEYDPVRDYLPSSPYCSEDYFRLGKDNALLPEVHLWGPRGYYKAPFYTEVNAHFVSEIGYHGCPDYS